jgi:hypothetical protein
MDTCQFFGLSFYSKRDNEDDDTIRSVEMLPISVKSHVEQILLWGWVLALSCVTQ